MADMQFTEKQIEEYALIWADELCRCAGENEEFAGQFKKKLLASPGVYGEYVYYMMHQNFASEYKIQGVSLVDIMIWQIDHFKAGLDMGKYDMRENGDKMLLMAFDTMLSMEKDPLPYLEKMKQESGSDYPDKF